MELLDETLSKLNINTAEIKVEDLQNVLLTLKRIGSQTENLSAHYDKIVEKLWLHLVTEFQEFDDQLLCSISFYTVLSKSKNQEQYLLEVLKIINHEMKLKNDITTGSRISLVISLSYGIFQSSYLLQQSGSNEILEETLKVIFQLLIQKAYEYTQYTFIVFKIMTSFKKVAHTELQKHLLHIDNQIKLLNLINHNWENPITGVRNLNRIIFQNLLMVLNEDVYETVLYNINFFYWNKAKYLMLAEIIEHSKDKIEHLVAEYGCLDGLVSSLSKPGLVSAGTDMYNAILKKIDSAESWTTMFLVNVVEILGGSCFKAIENFNNYWCLNTLKKFPSLLEVIINEVNNINKAEHKLYSTISIMKQGNKLGLLQKTSNSCYELKEKLVLFSLEHLEPTIRMLAFEIVCVSQQNCLPSVIEYNKVLRYLTNNVNSDCTVLRISMINSLSFFLTKLHTLFINTTQISSSEDIQCLYAFCEELQDFIVTSLDCNGNYQRKMTTIKITYTVLLCLTEVPRKKHKQLRKTNKSLMSFVRENSHWKLNTNNFIMKLFKLLKDPANDIHEGVLQILSEFYIVELSEQSIINYLIEEGVKCISSKFFYEISSGQIIFKLIANILIKHKVDSKFESLEDIFYFAYNELNLENCKNRDILKSIEDGKQSHSFLSILSIVLETSIKNHYLISIPKEIIFSLMSIVEHISNQFVWEEDLSNCSDYSKMNDMIQKIVKNSGLESQGENDHTKISGLHQIVLNCLWLNVKASCELASLLIQYFKQDIIISEKCLNIITHVLETSRHKGVIEAAGATLGASIQFLTSLADELYISELPFTLLKTKLNELLFETDKMSSVTRRGAGLSIMIHRIVSNDCNKGKPLFHYFIKILLNTCKSLDDSHNNEDMTEIDNNDKDIPKAIHIHFLTRIVTDSSLASDIMYYSAELAALAFDNLTNNHWQIRNAALQLYGALIPKLIGQKKLSGTGEETIATVACDEFRTHSPELWYYMIYQITKQEHEDIIQAHSNLVPILNVLACFAKKYNFPGDEEENSDLDLLHLFNLLGSPIYTVRRLTAQCIPNIYSFDNIYEALDNNKCYTENYLHGTLMLISNCCKTYCNTKNVMPLQSLIRKYQNIILQRNHSYLCQWSLEKLFEIPEKVTIEMFNKILLEVNDNRYKPGVSLWANLKVHNSLENMPWSMIAEILENLIKSNEFEICGEAIVKRIRNDTEPFEKDLQKIAQILLSSEMVTKSSTLWKLLYYISLKIDISFHLLNISQLHSYIENISYNLRYIIPFAARLLKNQIDNENVLLLTQSIFSMCNPGRNDVDIRYVGVLANNEFGDELCKHSDDVKINSIKSAIILLQDEDEDIRNLSVKFYDNVMKESKHPFICLYNILNMKFLRKLLHDPVTSIQRICDDLLCFIDSISKTKDNDYNPFSNDSKNIYLETSLFRQTLQDLKNASC